LVIVLKTSSLFFLSCGVVGAELTCGMFEKTSETVGFDGVSPN